MKTFHWGHALLLFFTCYVGFLAFVLVKSTRVDHTLVLENYYEHDLAFQTRYDDIQNRKNLNNDLTILFTPEDRNITLDFGDTLSQIEGSIQLYSPIDKKNDRVFTFQLDHNQVYHLPLNLQTSGRYQVQVEWKDTHLSYYKEEEIYYVAL